MAIGERWLGPLRPFVLARLPPAPASVIEIGCGTVGGFVPELRQSGYEAVGVDRNAPDGPGFQQLDFEDYEPSRSADAILASRSLHHVRDVDEVLDGVAAALRPGGVIVVLEWAWERFDEATARWCFARLEPSPPQDPGWLQRRRDGWLASGEAWQAYFEGWAEEHGLQRSDRVLAGLEARFERTSCEYAPYFFADLAGGSEQAEQAAIDAGEIRATGIRYAGRLR
ncbi:MAG: class I SAM-dependent methyltransferase [Actinomycetota bacterium]|nr:class I SAM-dependent methyltransferase [Actinomycetota bacterium]